MSTTSPQEAFSSPRSDAARPGRIRAGTKKAGVLRVLLERGERGLNRFEAESACHDHVLPSTIADLCSDYGLVIPRKLETVRGHLGHDTECSRYFLSLEDRAKVPWLLGDVPLVPIDTRAEEARAAWIRQEAREREARMTARQKAGAA